MIIYNVTVSIDQSIHEDWLQWMKEIHIPEVMETGFFLENKVCRLMVSFSVNSKTLTSFATDWLTARNMQIKTLKNIFMNKIKKIR